MSAIHSDLGRCSKGDVVEITLTRAANVRLLDSSNFSRYKRGDRHRYRGGLAKRSPVRLAIPSSGHWHAVVDMQGLRGSTRASVRVIPVAATQPLPELKSPARSLSDVAENFARVSTSDRAREFDVFISHASEDKDSVVRPLAEALRSRGLRVWYDEFELRLGDSLRRKIDGGISRSRFGLVVLSKTFFEKGWAGYELDGIVTMAVSGDQVLLPVWHGISRDDVIAASPSLADRFALRTADLTIAEIAEQIADVIANSEAAE